VNLDGSVSNFSVQAINGTDYIYDLRGSGQLWRGLEGPSSWTGWTQLDAGVASIWRCNRTSQAIARSWRAWGRWRRGRQA
jgi:hypothetical protein